MKQIINDILSKMFPFVEYRNKNSVFIQQTWLEKVMQPLFVKDYLWFYK